jgi:hypothetical protein
MDHMSMVHGYAERRLSQAREAARKQYYRNKPQHSASVDFSSKQLAPGFYSNTRSKAIYYVPVSGIVKGASTKLASHNLIPTMFPDQLSSLHLTSHPPADAKQQRKLTRGRWAEATRYFIVVAASI